jgi:uncharacterized protein with HEPN domain
LTRSSGTVHAYFGLDDDIVWDVVANKVQPLHDQVRQLLSAQKVSPA